MFDLYQTLFIIFMSGFTSYVTSVLSFIVKFLMSKLFYIVSFNSSIDSPNTTQIIDLIKESCGFIERHSVVNGEREPEGVCISIEGKFVAFVTVDYKDSYGDITKQTTVHVVSTKPIKLKEMTKIKNIYEEKNLPVVTAYMSGSHFTDNYFKIEIPVCYEPYLSQDILMDRIIEEYNKSNTFVCRTLIHGEPGLGKSMIGKLLAKRLDTSLCFDFNLLLPGARLMELYRQVEPDKDNPLIIQIDEFDILVTNIHNQENIRTINWAPNKVHDKSSYNTFFSEHVPCFPYVIYILTSNRPIEYFDSLDKSYVGSNRIDIKAHMKSKNCTKFYD